MGFLNFNGRIGPPQTYLYFIYYLYNGILHPAPLLGRAFKSLPLHRDPTLCTLMVGRAFKLRAGDPAYCGHKLFHVFPSNFVSSQAILCLLKQFHVFSSDFMSSQVILCLLRLFNVFSVSSMSRV